MKTYDVGTRGLPRQAAFDVGTLRVIHDTSSARRACTQLAAAGSSWRGEQPPYPSANLLRRKTNQNSAALPGDPSSVPRSPASQRQSGPQPSSKPSNFTSFDDPNQRSRARGGATQASNPPPAPPPRRQACPLPPSSRPSPPPSTTKPSPPSAPTDADVKRRAARKAARQADKVAAATRNTQGCCYGCGTLLQTTVPRAAGYVDPAKYAVRQQRRQLDTVLCARCGELCNGAMIPGVEDFTQKLLLRQTLGEAAVGGTAGTGPSSTAAVPSGATNGSEVDRSGQTTTTTTVSLPSSSATAAAASTSSTAAAERSLLGKVLVTPEQLRSQLTQLSLRAAVVVLLVDLTDASGSLLARVRELVGRNPIVMVGTKMDLLPESCKPREVAEWLAGAAASRKLNVVSVHLVSSHTGEGMSAAVTRICRERRSRDVFVVGAANVGKSAFVGAMLKELARTEPAAIGTGKYLPVESAMPGTTLGLIPLKAFSGGGILYDTPGVHLHHRIPHMLTPEELKLLHPRRRLTVLVPPLPAELRTEAEAAEVETEVEDAVQVQLGAKEEEMVTSGGIGSRDGVVRQGLGGLKIVDHVPTDEYGMPIEGLDAASVAQRRAGRQSATTAAAEGNVRHGGGGLAVRRRDVSATYMWSDLVRVDVLSGPADVALVFYGPSSMRVVGLPYIRPDQRLVVDYGVSSDSEPDDNTSPAPSSPTPTNRGVLVCSQSVAARGGLQGHDLVLRAAGGAVGGGAVADVAISGLPGWVAVWAPRIQQDIRLRVWAPRGVEVMTRPALPCPPPLALQRAWKGERRGGGREDGEDEEEDGVGEEGGQLLSELSRQLAGSTRDPTNDPQWWEAMAALKDEDLRPALGGRRRNSAAASRTLADRGSGGNRGERADSLGVPEGKDGGGDDDDDDLPDWDEEAELLDDEDGDIDWEEEEEEGLAAGGRRERVLVSARVEDILKRPRLDVLAQMDLDLQYDEDEEEGEDQDEVGGMDEDRRGARIDDFTLTKRAGGGRWAEGPMADGGWDPLAGLSAGARGRRGGGRASEVQEVLEPARTGAGLGRSKRLMASSRRLVKEEDDEGMAVQRGSVRRQEREEEEDAEEDEEVAVRQRPRGLGLRGLAGRRMQQRPGRLGRRREVVRVVEADGVGDEEGVVGETQ